jgi:hypothetical protein
MGRAFRDWECTRSKLHPLLSVSINLKNLGDIHWIPSGSHVSHSRQPYNSNSTELVGDREYCAYNWFCVLWLCSFAIHNWNSRVKIRHFEPSTIVCPVVSPLVVSDQSAKHGVNDGLNDWAVVICAKRQRPFRMKHWWNRLLRLCFISVSLSRWGKPQ